MKVDQSQHFYNNEQHILQNSEQIEGSIYIDMDIALQSDALIDFQKDIFNEYFWFLVDQIKQAKAPTQREIKKIFEHTLQELNSKLSIFANKMAKVDYFPIKGCIKVLHNNILMASLVWNVSIMIFRDKKLLYAVNNEYKATWKIDFFSEFVEWEIQTEDEIILIGNNVYTVFDKREIKRFNEVFMAQDEDICEFLEEIISMRIEKKEIALIINTTYDVSSDRGLINTSTSSKKKLLPQPNVKNFVQKNKFLVSIGFLGLLIIILIRNIIKWSSIVSYPVFVDEYGKQNEITPEKIKKDIAYFQKLDPSSDEKSHMYRTIIEQLDYIQSQWYRPEDIDNRRRIIEKYYNKWFNIVYETALKNFDDELNGTRAEILSFNETELTSIWEPKSLVVNSSISVWGSNGSIIWLVNNDIRWSLVTHTEEDETIIGCSSNILRDWLYCYNENWNIYNISKAWSTVVTTESPGGFPGQILWLEIFGKTNLYVLNKVSYLNQEWIYISRYRNTIGSQTQFGPATDYQLPIVSWSQYPDITNMAIDGSFLVRSTTDKTLLQRWREGTTLSLNSRQIPILGWDQSQETRGENVKILTNVNTRYILIFDKDNNSLTVYDSQWLKTNDANATNFSLQYIMKFKLDLESESIIDMSINENDSNQVNLYILTDKGVYKIKLFEFIQEIKNNESKTTQQ